MKHVLSNNWCWFFFFLFLNTVVTVTLRNYNINPYWLNDNAFWSGAVEGAVLMGIAIYIANRFTKHYGV